MVSRKFQDSFEKILKEVFAVPCEKFEVVSKVFQKNIKGVYQKFQWSLKEVEKKCQVF